MTSRRTREQLKVQILEAERMYQLVANHPVMSVAFQKKIEDLKQQLDTIPINTKEPTVALLFSGKPVWGSNGIDASFISKAILPFQKMVHADLIQRYGKVGGRGQLKNSDEAKLFVTALRKGSFGVELSKLSDDLFPENIISDSLVGVSKLVEASARSDEDFAASLANVSERSIKELKTFLKVVSDDDAGLTIESGGIRASLAPKEVKDAYKRVSETKTVQSEEQIKGILKGILLESRKFDFVDKDQKKITGTLSDDMSDESAIGLNSSFFNQEGIASFQKTTISLKGGQIKETFVLKGIVGIER